jgi:hypothetical protein
MAGGMYDCTLDFDLFEHYIYGKQNRVKFSYDATREKRILELVHHDVFGPVFVPSLGKYVYYVYYISFIDDSLRITWIYFLRNKYDVCWVCVIFFARVVVSERLRQVRRGGAGAAPPNFFFFTG